MTPVRIKPFFTFYGGKYRIAPRYPKPEFGTIVEPFAGSAGYSLRYYDRNVILVECDEQIAETWRYLIRARPRRILQLPDLKPRQSVDDLPSSINQEERWLIGWWCNRGASRPRKRMATWGIVDAKTRGHQVLSWGQPARERIASQVEHIRHWCVRQGNYTLAPNNVQATWFIDPPYEKTGKHYFYRIADYKTLAKWCRTRRGQTIVCENVGATWLPFKPFLRAKANESRTGGKISHEAIWTKWNE